MGNLRSMLVNGCNIVYCANERERNDFAKKFLNENPEYAFEVRAEFMDTKKRLFGNPSAFDILTKNKTIRKTKNNEEIISLLRKLDIYQSADRVPRALSFGQRIIYSVAYDMLEKGKTTFLISEGERYTQGLLKGIASLVHSNTWSGELKFVWITDTAHRDAEILDLCDGLFELNNGKLIKHDVKKESGSVKKESLAVSKVSSSVATNTSVKSQQVSKPKLISKDRMPLPGKVCRLNDGSDGVVLAKYYSPFKNSECYRISIREFKTGEVSELTVMWSKRAETPIYYSSYKSSYARAGAKASKLGDFVCYYEQEARNVEYESYEAELRYCTYIGEYLCKDLFTGEIYRPEVKEPIRKELEMVKKGDIVSICLYGGKVYFGGSYRTEIIVSLFASDQKGTLRYYDVSDYGLIYTNTVYMEKDGNLVDVIPEKDKLYILHRVITLQRKNHSKYVAGGIVSPFAWVIPAKGQIKYGLLEGKVNEELNWKTLSFTPFHEEEPYLVNKKIFSEEFFEFLCEKAIPVKAEVFEYDYKLAIPSEEPLERQTLTCTYKADDVAMCMDIDTCELSEIPCSDLPADITEGCTFVYYPEVKYASLVEMEADDEEEPKAESITTYEGYDAARQAHIIRIVDGYGNVNEYTYDNENIEFVESGIEKGTRVSMRLSFNDDTCSLNAHLSKYED